MSDAPRTKERSAEIEVIIRDLKIDGYREEAEIVADLVAEREGLRKALRALAEGGLGDEPWFANYDRIREYARNALERHP